MRISLKEMGVIVSRIVRVCVFTSAVVICACQGVCYLKSRAHLRCLKHYDPVYLNLGRVRCHVLVRSFDIERGEDHVIPIVESLDGLLMTRATKILLLNNTRSSDWRGQRDDAVLAVGVMHMEKEGLDTVVFIATPKGVWGLGEADPRRALVIAELNKKSCRLEDCSASAMGFADCPSVRGNGFEPMSYEDYE